MRSTIRELIGEDREKSFVTPDDSIRQTIQYMSDKNIGAVAVCDGDTLVGIFSKGDLLRRVVLKGLDLDEVPVKDVMTSPVHWIAMDERYEIAKAIMVDKGHDHLAVKDDDMAFNSLVTASELLQADLKDSRELVGKLNDDYYEHRFQP